MGAVRAPGPLTTSLSLSPHTPRPVEAPLLMLASMTTSTPPPPPPGCPSPHLDDVQLVVQYEAGLLLVRAAVLLLGLREQCSSRGGGGSVSNEDCVSA